LFPKQLFPGFSWQDMWIHSVTCGLAAEHIYGRIAGGTRGSNESAFIAGLLHDVGKLVLARALPHRFIQVVQACTEYNYDMLRAENNILGTDHTKVGAELTEQWEFPSKLQAGIAYHHMPEAASEHEDIARAVQAANLLAKRFGRNYLMGVPVEISMKDVADAAGLPVADMDFVVNQVRDGLRQCSELLAWAEDMPDSNKAKAA
jgi:HD-like signal output (HDOD) protein